MARSLDGLVLSPVTGRAPGRVGTRTGDTLDFLPWESREGGGRSTVGGHTLS
ncbi:hypothetical protein [Streptomyces sp. NBC_01363]|uniref:hypothetical protein n=1 Tax=Streptomyces sp. NBC_01363 TaxID=2903840 RepID=UPI002253B57F|nr:hypothetical protein [Streptomyces sp. NBC_01363]MCX4732581.1 hypothetical protein [Streptomyces sp. NBC_01363]